MPTPLFGADTLNPVFQAITNPSSPSYILRAKTLFTSHCPYWSPAQHTSQNGPPLRRPSLTARTSTVWISATLRKYVALQSIVSECLCSKISTRAPTGSNLRPKAIGAFATNIDTGMQKPPFFQPVQTKWRTKGAVRKRASARA